MIRSTYINVYSICNQVLLKYFFSFFKWQSIIWTVQCNILFLVDLEINPFVHAVKIQIIYN